MFYARLPCTRNNFSLLFVLFAVVFALFFPHFMLSSMDKWIHLCKSARDNRPELTSADWICWFCHAFWTFQIILFHFFVPPNQPCYTRTLHYTHTCYIYCVILITRATWHGKSARLLFRVLSHHQFNYTKLETMFQKNHLFFHIEYSFSYKREHI